MNQRERQFIVAVLGSIVVLVSTDLLTDLSEGVRWWHAALEGGIALSALVGIFLLIRSSIDLKHSLIAERSHSSELQKEALRWRSETKKYIDGLSLTIDHQLSTWQLTHSEKEVAFLLLKGLSLKDLAEIRKTTEKTARAQSIAIYAKAGVAGRSELAAFFLEDLLPPASPKASPEPQGGPSTKTPASTSG